MEDRKDRISWYRKSWQVSAILVELEKNIAYEFNLKHQLSKTQLPLSVSHIQAIGDRVVLKSSKVSQQVAKEVEEEEREKAEKLLIDRRKEKCPD